MDISDNVAYDDEGKEIFVFKGEEDIEIDDIVESKINSFLGAKGAICMDDKTKLKRSESFDYGPIKDSAGNIIELTPDEIKIREDVRKYYEHHEMDIPKDVEVQLTLDGKKAFVRNSIFH
jgi:hypothetical protein